MSSLSLSTTLGDFSIKLAKRHLTLNALVITMLTCASVQCRAATIGPLNANQLPNGLLTIGIEVGSSTGAASLFYCGGTFSSETDAPPCGAPSTVPPFPVDLTISGNTGTNFWTFTNVSNQSVCFNPKGCPLILTQLQLIFDPSAYYPDLAQPSSAFFSKAFGPQYIAGTVPLTMTYGNLDDPSPGPGLYWDLTLTFSSAAPLEPGSSVTIYAPLFTSTPEPSGLPFVGATLGLLFCVYRKFVKRSFR